VRTRVEVDRGLCDLYAVTPHGSRHATLSVYHFLHVKRDNAEHACDELHNCKVCIVEPIQLMDVPKSKPVLHLSRLRFATDASLRLMS
jgi:hypothetical protein